MTVAELRKALEAFPDEMQVVSSKDAEGNGFSPAHDLTVGRYEPESTYSGEFDDGASDHRNAVCIWPVN